MRQRLPERDGARLVVLQACADTLMPALPIRAAEERAAGNEALARSFETSGGQGNMSKILELIATRLALEDRMDLLMFLDALGSHIGTLLLCGRFCLSWRFPFVHTWSAMPQAARELAMLSWAASRFVQLRKGFKALKVLINSSLLSEVDDAGDNVYLSAIDYPTGNREQRKPVLRAAQQAEQTIASGICDMTTLANTDADEIHASLSALGLMVAKDKEAPSSITVECDVVICGSGAGGGVAAAVLAEAGHRVIVVEKATWRRAADLSLEEGDSMANMYEAGGLLATDDSGVGVLAGSTLGGGTRVNWCASFVTPEHVRREWAQQHGLPAFTSDRYTASLDAVCRRLSVSTGVIHNGQNARLKKGLEALSGVHCAEIPRNCGDELCSGFCAFGCASGSKQDVVNTWLCDAVSHGARILTGLHVDEVILEGTSPVGQHFGGDNRPRRSTAGPRTKAKRAVGILAIVAGRDWQPQRQRHEATGEIKLMIKSRVVISSCGALHTPALLLRSGVRGYVGRNLKLHPAVFVAAEFPKAQGRVDYWQGAMMTTYSKHVADWEGDAYGPFVSVPQVCMRAQAHPGIHAAVASWPGGSAFREALHRIPVCMTTLVYQRDSGSGRVRLDSRGMPRLTYWPSKRDQESMLRGVELAARAMLAAGAEMITLLNSGPSLEFRPADGGSLDVFLSDIRKAGIKRNVTQLFSAHQMSTARMGCDPSSSVTDSTGECWDVEGLYCCDASVFPTSTGVNPMITVEATAHMLALDLADKMACKRSSLKYD